MDWKGYTIELKNKPGHRTRITNRWKPEKYDDMWWWKCLDCTKSAGVLSGKDLIKLKARGYVKAPRPDDKDLNLITLHPDENSAINRYCGYGEY